MRASAGFDYSAAFAAADRTLRLFLTADAPVDEPPASILAELGGLSARLEGEVTALTPERAAVPFLVRWLVKKSHACRFDSPDEMLQWALMARIAADSCSAKVAGSSARLADIRASAEAQLANALRILGRSEESETIFESAQRYLAKGSGDIELLGSVLQKEASLFILQGRLAMAADSLGEASRIWEELGSRRQLAKTAVIRGVACRRVREFDREILLLEHALPLIDPHQEAYFPLLIRNNLINAYVESGKQREARVILSEAQKAVGHVERYGSIGSRLLWNEGKLLVTLGMIAAAESSLARARAGFSRLGLVHGLVLVTQELVCVQQQLGRRHEVEQSIAAASAEVNARRSGPETIQALQELQSSL